MIRNGARPDSILFPEEGDRLGMAWNTDTSADLFAFHAPDKMDFIAVGKVT